MAAQITGLMFGSTSGDRAVPQRPSLSMFHALLAEIRLARPGFLQNLKEKKDAGLKAAATKATAKRTLLNIVSPPRQRVASDLNIPDAESVFEARQLC